MSSFPTAYTNPNPYYTWGATLEEAGELISSRLSSATQQVQGQSRLHVTLSLKALRERW